MIYIIIPQWPIVICVVFRPWWAFRRHFDMFIIVMLVQLMFGQLCQ